MAMCGRGGIFCFRIVNMIYKVYCELNQKVIHVQSLSAWDHVVNQNRQIIDGSVKTFETRTKSAKAVRTLNHKRYKDYKS